MVERYYVGAYWGARRESPEECAARLAGYLACLAQGDPCFTHWFMLGNSREDALARQVTPDVATLRQLLLDGRIRAESGASIENLGSVVGLWTGGEDEESANLVLTCGSDAHPTNANACVVYLPYGGASATRLQRTPLLATVLTCAVSAWEPDWGLVNSNQYDPPVSPDNRPRVGWMVYLSRRRGAVPPLPAPARVVPVGQWGSLVVVTDERFTASNPAHLASAARVAERLDQAGLRTALS